MLSLTALANRGILLRTVLPRTGKLAWCLLTPVSVTPEAMVLRVSSPRSVVTIPVRTSVPVDTRLGSVVVYYTRSHGVSGAEVSIGADESIEVIRAGYNGPKLLG